MKLKLIITALLIFVWLISNAQAEKINFSVAASMTDAFKDIIAHFSTVHPESELQLNFASSGSLAKQIEQGAPADIYVSANPKWMKYLVDEQLIEPGTDRIFAYNTLVFIGTGGGVGVDLNSLAKLDRIALGTPQSVPAGQYAKQAMENSGVYAELEKKRKLIMAKDVRQALLYADRGEVDGAFVYKTDALLAASVTILFVVPDGLHDPIAYLFALTVNGAKKDLARSFADFMKSPGAIAILDKYGFQPAR